MNYQAQKNPLNGGLGDWVGNKKPTIEVGFLIKLSYQAIKLATLSYMSASLSKTSISIS